MAIPTYYGKYRAKVVDVRDPEKRGRIRVQCPKVLGDSKSAWCETCVPVAGDNEGDFCLPPVGETVWVEFEEGDANRPVLTGGWYGTAKSPKSDYGDASNERIISFKGTKITMRSGQCTVATADSSVVLKNNHVIITTDGYQPPGDPPPDPISKVKVDIAKDNISLSVNSGAVKAEVKNSGIDLDVGSSTAKLTSSAVEIKNGTSVARVNASGIDLTKGSSTAKVLSNSIEASIGSSTVNLTSSEIELVNGSTTANVSSSGVELNSGSNKAVISPSTLELSNGSTKLSVQSGKIILTVGGVSCELTSSTLTTLKGLIE